MCSGRLGEKGAKPKYLSPFSSHMLSKTIAVSLWCQSDVAFIPQNLVPTVISKLYISWTMSHNRLKWTRLSAGIIWWTRRTRYSGRAGIPGSAGSCGRSRTTWGRGRTRGCRDTRRTGSRRRKGTLQHWPMHSLYTVLSSPCSLYTLIQNY